MLNTKQRGRERELKKRQILRSLPVEKRADLAKKAVEKKEKQKRADVE